MAILKDHSSKPSCEVEIKLILVNDESVKFGIVFRTGPTFPEIHTEISCLKRDFLKLLDDLKRVDHTHLSMLEHHDPGLCIYHIPEYGTYYYPDYGLFQVPEHERQDNEPRFKLIFVLDAKEKNNYGLRECGPALCLIVKMEQINQFVDSLKLEVTTFSNI